MCHFLVMHSNSAFSEAPSERCIPAQNAFSKIAFLNLNVLYNMCHSEY